MNSTDKLNNLDILSLWILPIVTLLVKYKTLVVDLNVFRLHSHSGRYWYPLALPFPLAHKNGTFTMFKITQITKLLTLSFLKNNSFQLCSTFQFFGNLMILGYHVYYKMLTF